MVLCSTGWPVARAKQTLSTQQKKQKVNVTSVIQVQVWYSIFLFNFIASNLPAMHRLLCFRRT